MFSDYRHEKWTAESNGETLNFAEYLYYSARNYILPLICKVRGHEWIEDGYAGPDSGAMYMSCSRCGESHTHILY